MARLLVKLAGIIWHSVVLFCLFSISSWYVVLLVLSDVMNGNVLWYCMTWVVLVVASILIARCFDGASPALMSLSFFAICLAIEQFDESSGFGNEYWPYVTGTMLTIYLASWLALGHRRHINGIIRQG